MNLPNKITLGRIFLSILIIIIMMFPFYEMGIDDTKYLIMGKVTISLKYIICKQTKKTYGKALTQGFFFDKILGRDFIQNLWEI